MEWYTSMVMQHPIVSSMIQFAILGTFGEYLSHKIKGAKRYPFTVPQTIFKMLIWMVLAIGIKYAFKGFVYFADGLASSGFLPAAAENYDKLLKQGIDVTWSQRFAFAFSVSCFMNFLFAPQMMYVHRWLDNIVDRRRGNYKGMDTALESIIWFWIPAHTLTFMLPDVYRIGLAAVWGIVLGVIMGYAGVAKSAIR
jgi:hypothetical protein